MKTATARDRKSTDISRMAAGKRFRKYNGENEKAVRKAETKQDLCIRELTETFTRFTAYTFQMALEDSNLADIQDVELELYNKAVEHVKVLDYSPSDVERFSIILPQVVQELEVRGISTLRHAGPFLSALVNEGNGRAFTLQTEHSDLTIRGLGYANRKDVTIKGDVGIWLGHGMTSGTIHVLGNANGLIGYRMRGGRIFVDGNVTLVGEALEGGEIHIGGEIIELREDVANARIFHKGKLIVDK
jgi:hypothetical protein